ncbi:hypothetical protein SAMN05216436_1214 [bacterium A37T11]|nr:hypothetical protein SAMN05216436_1214 [bacterium A37T11]
MQNAKKILVGSFIFVIMTCFSMAYSQTSQPDTLKAHRAKMIVQDLGISLGDAQALVNIIDASGAEFKKLVQSKLLSAAQLTSQHKAIEKKRDLEIDKLLDPEIAVRVKSKLNLKFDVPAAAAK